MKLASAFLFVAVTEPLAGQEAVRLLDFAETAYEQITTLEAHFTQTIINPMLGDPEESEGVLYLSPPDRFAMRFSEPVGDRIVADGTWLWLYTPSTVPNQVIRQPIPAGGAATPNIFAQFVQSPLDRYTATYEGEDTVVGHEVGKVRLVPRVAGLSFREAVISVSRDDGVMRKLDFIEESGQRRILVFSTIVLNHPLPAAEMMFRPPKGTRIVSP